MNPRGINPLRAGGSDVERPGARDATVAAVRLAWRRLTGDGRGRRAGRGAPTLLACSGGADSSALVLALAGAGARCVVGHVVHDLRRAAEAEGDRDAARELARLVGARFVEARIAARAGGGNLEAGARRLRYAALARLAGEAGVGFVATGHHAHDQVETVLMALVRGAALPGLRGLAARRPIGSGAGSGVELIRPMLGVTPDEARGLCARCGWAWREDASNADVTRLRAAVRHTVLPALLGARPGAAGRIVDAAAGVAEAADHLARAADALGPPPWGRAALRGAHPAVVATLLRRAARTRGADGTREGARGEDRMARRTLMAATRLIRSDDTSPREARVGPLVLRITAREVAVMTRRG